MLINVSFDETSRRDEPFMLNNAYLEYRCIWNDKIIWKECKLNNWKWKKNLFELFI